MSATRTGSISLAVREDTVTTDKRYVNFETEKDATESQRDLVTSHAADQLGSDAESSVKEPGIGLSRSAMQHASQDSGIAGRALLANESGGR